MERCTWTGRHSRTQKCHRTTNASGHEHERGRKARTEQFDVRRLRKTEDVPQQTPTAAVCSSPELALVRAGKDAGGRSRHQKPQHNAWYTHATVESWPPLIRCPIPQVRRQKQPCTSPTRWHSAKAVAPAHKHDRQVWVRPPGSTQRNDPSPKKPRRERPATDRATKDAQRRAKSDAAAGERAQQPTATTDGGWQPPAGSPAVVPAAAAA